MQELNKESILRMARGAIEERTDYEVSRVIDNIMDLNTDPKAKRKISLTLTFAPDATRSIIQLFVDVKSTLCPTGTVSTALCITSDNDGEMVIAEMTPQIPGQISITGEVQEPPKILKLVAQA